MRREGKILYVTEAELNQLTRPRRTWRLLLIALAFPVGFALARMLDWLAGYPL